MSEDEEIKNLVGKPFLSNIHNLKYGGSVDSNGIIREALTKNESEEMKKKCPVDKANLLFAEDLRECVGYDIDEDVIDDILEFLRDQGVLTPKGIELSQAFWERYIHTE